MSLIFLWSPLRSVGDGALVIAAGGTFGSRRAPVDPAPKRAVLPRQTAGKINPSRSFGDGAGRAVVRRKPICAPQRAADGVQGPSRTNADIRCLRANL